MHTHQLSLQLLTLVIYSAQNFATTLIAPSKSLNPAPQADFYISRQDQPRIKASRSLPSKLLQAPDAPISSQNDYGYSINYPVFLNQWAAPPELAWPAAPFSDLFPVAKPANTLNKPPMPMMPKAPVASLPQPHKMPTVSHPQQQPILPPASAKSQQQRPAHSPPPPRYRSPLPAEVPRLPAPVPQQQAPMRTPILPAQQQQNISIAVKHSPKPSHHKSNKIIDLTKVVAAPSAALKPAADRQRKGEVSDLKPQNWTKEQTEQAENQHGSPVLPGQEQTQDNSTTTLKPFGVAAADPPAISRSKPSRGRGKGKQKGNRQSGKKGAAADQQQQQPQRKKITINLANGKSASVKYKKGVATKYGKSVISPANRNIHTRNGTSTIYLPGVHGFERTFSQQARGLFCANKMRPQINPYTRRTLICSKSEDCQPGFACVPSVQEPKHIYVCCKPRNYHTRNFYVPTCPSAHVPYYPFGSTVALKCASKEDCPTVYECMQSITTTNDDRLCCLDTRGPQPEPQSITKSDLPAIQTAQVADAAQSTRGVCDTPGCVIAAAELLGNIDETVKPCDNFYQYACGKWLRDNPIPEDKSSVDSFNLVNDRVRIQLKGLLEANDYGFGGGDSAVVNNTRKFYKSCIDIDGLAKKKSGPLLTALQRMGGWPALGGESNSSMDLSDLLIILKRDYTMDPFWDSSASPDDKNVTRMALIFDQPSLTLGSRDYYLNATQHRDTLEAYKTWIGAVLGLLAEDGGFESDAKRRKKEAEKILEFETKIAKITRKEEDRRNFTQMYNLWTVAELRKAMPFLNWDKFFDAYLPTEVRPLYEDDSNVVIYEPDYMRHFADLVARTDDVTVKNFAIWQSVNNMVTLLDERYANVKQDFLKVFTGREQRPPRWKSCIESTTSHFDMAAGAIYIDRYFGETDKQEADQMIKNLMATLANMIKQLAWMDQTTKRIALAKLYNIAPMIGYPDFVKTSLTLDDYYKELSVLPTDGYFEISSKSGVFLQNRNLRKLLAPTNRFEFEMSPATVNAYYNLVLNSMVYPAAILQPPFFHGEFPKSVNYAAIGSVIGHELTHGFDDQGSQYDENGHLHNWWSPASQANFLNRTKCIIDQYSNYRDTLAGMYIRGKMTQGENIADNGGVKEAFRAYQAYQTKNGPELRLPGLNKTNEQVFFLAYASVWCNNRKQQSAVQDILGDVHSPGEFRVIGPLSNLREFSQAFSCPEGSPMNPLRTSRTKCEVW